MKIIAQQGGAFLVEVGKGESVVVDKFEVSTPFNTQSYLARGYWEDYNGPEIDVAMKKRIEEVIGNE